MEQPILELTVKCDACRSPFKILLDAASSSELAAHLPEGGSTLLTICPDCRANRFNERQLYEADAGDRVRLAIPYNGVWRHIFWLRVSRDGDIYCTFGYGDDHIVEAGTGRAISDGTRVEVKYAAERREISGPLKGGRVSFHASGQINLADLKLKGTPLLDRTRQETLAAMVFEHPSSFPALGAVGSRDIVLPFAVAEDRALVGALHFVPPEQQVTFRPGIREIGEPRRELVIRSAGVSGSPSGDLTLYVALGRGPRINAWPPVSYFVVASEELADTA